MEKIFVSITSYRDPECQWTVKDLFEKAAHPERVFVGICWQFDETEDKACFSEPCPRPAQLRTLKFTPRESKGSSWARMQAQSLWRGEEYVLQIHAHMRFEQGWDDTLIAMLARCPSKKAVLTTCLPTYTPPNEYPFRDEARASFIMVQAVTPDEPQMVHFTGGMYHKDSAMAGPLRTPFWVGNFLFARSELMHSVPFDPNIFYYGETVAYSARLWTHGYDMFEPDELVAYHWWSRPASIRRPYREASDERHTKSTMRVKHLLRLKAASDSSAIAELEQYGLGNERSLSDFWQFAGINLATGDIAEAARKGAWEERYIELQESKKAPAPKAPRIFVQIASYRDPECQWTLKDMFEKAKDPDRVFAGICWQYDPEEDKACFQITTRPDQVRIASFHWKESQGVCWARMQTQQLWKDEEYTLCIDSHMRFEFDWDEKFITELNECPSAKAVLSNHPASYAPPHDLETNVMPTILRAHIYTPDGEMRFRGDFLDRLPQKPLRGAFVAAGQIFAKSDIIQEVPYDPYLYFNQEEVSLAARFYTHGYDIYSPREVLLYHFYNPTPDKNKRPLHWDDEPKWQELHARSRKRVDSLLGFAPSDDPEVTRDLTKYGMGSVRSLKEFEEFCGIDFKTHTVSDRALRCGFIPNLSDYKDEPIHIPEIDGEKKPKRKVTNGSAEVFTFPDPEQSAKLSYDTMLLANGELRTLNVDPNTPEGVLVIYDYIEPPICEALKRYADSQTFTDLDVVVPADKNNKAWKSERNSGRITHHVEIDGMAAEILSIFNDIYCRRLAPFYNVDFEWYERPQILRYPPGGKYNQHADADHWVAETKSWMRVQDRDYSVLLYLNDEYEGGEIQLIEQNFTLKPKPGMLLAFPSDHKYLHAALPTTSGIRYVIVSWAAIMGSKRMRPQPPYASVFVRQKRHG